MQHRCFLTKPHRRTVLPVFPLRHFRTSTPLFRADFYGELGVSRDASQADIKKAYFQMAKKYHPDVNKSPEAQEKFAKLSTAYETLSDENKRRIYDQTGMTGDE